MVANSTIQPLARGSPGGVGIPVLAANLRIQGYNGRRKRVQVIGRSTAGEAGNGYTRWHESDHQRARGGMVNPEVKAGTTHGIRSRNEGTQGSGQTATDASDTGITRTPCAGSATSTEQVGPLSGKDGSLAEKPCIIFQVARNKTRR